MKNYKKLLWLTMLVSMILIGSIILVNVIIDPYGIWGIYKKTGFNIKKVDPFDGFDERYSKPLELLKYKPEVIAVGSSRIWETLNLDYYSPKKGYNLAVSSANMYECRRLIEYAVLKSPYLNEVLLGIDFGAFNDNIKVEGAFNDKLLSGNNIELFKQFAKMIFSEDACKDSLRVVKANQEKNYYSPTMYKGKMTEIRLKEFYAPMLRNHFHMIAKNNIHINKNYILSRERMNDFKTVVDLCKEKKIKLKVFIPPLHAAYLQAIIASGSWEVYENWKRELVQIMPIIDFTGYNKYTTEPFSPDRKYFWDTSHSNLGNMMLDVLSGRRELGKDNFGVLLTAENVESNLQKVRAESYQWKEQNRDLAEEIGYSKGFILHRPEVLSGLSVETGKNIIHIDQISGRPLTERISGIKKDTMLNISGWTVTPSKASKKKIFAVLTSLSGQHFYTMAELYKREDITALMHGSVSSECGFSIFAPIDELSSGEYELRLIEVADKAYITDVLSILEIE